MVARVFWEDLAPVRIRVARQELISNGVGTPKEGEAPYGAGRLGSAPKTHPPLAEVLGGPTKNLHERPQVSKHLAHVMRQGRVVNLDKIKWVHVRANENKIVSRDPRRRSKISLVPKFYLPAYMTAFHPFFNLGFVRSATRLP